MTELLFYKFGFSWFGLVELATRFLKYEPIPASHFRPFLIPILIRYCFNFNNSLKKRRWCAGDLKPRSYGYRCSCLANSKPVNQEVSCAMILRLLSILFYTKVGKLLRPKVQSQAEANQCIYQIGGQYNL